MAGISVKLPLHANGEDGHYALNKTFIEATKQNLKNLLLTIPGERIMDPAFGVGLATNLFEQNMPYLRDEITARIHNQVNKYLPHVIIVDIDYSSYNESRDVGPNTLRVVLRYRVTPLNQSDLLDITIE